MIEKMYPNAQTSNWHNVSLLIFTNNDIDGLKIRSAEIKTKVGNVAFKRSNSALYYFVRSEFTMYERFGIS
jgi:hypothetical protein